MNAAICTLLFAVLFHSNLGEYHKRHPEVHSHPLLIGWYF